MATGSASGNIIGQKNISVSLNYFISPVLKLSATFLQFFGLAHSMPP